MLVAADARRIPLPDNSVQCCVTSPPYWGLRRYAGEQELTWDAIARNGVPVCAANGQKHAWGGANPAERKNEPGHFL